MLLGGWLFSIVMMIVDVKRWPIWIPVALMAVVTVVVIGLRYIRGRPRGL